jgi:V/A-type H+-transporting ATPase subunit I
LDRRTQLEIAEGVLAAFTPKKDSASKKKNKKEISQFEGNLAGHVFALSDRRKKLQDYMFNHQRERSRFEKWGEFDPNDFSYLADNGVNAYLYDVTLASYENNAKDVPVMVLSSDRKNNSVRLLAFDKIPGETPYPLPERPLSVVNERNMIRKAEMDKIEAQLAALSPLKNQIIAEKKALVADIEFESARAGMELIEDKGNSCGEANLAVSWISGYAPASDLGSLKRAASENGWAFCAADPAEDDTEVPTKLKNNRLTQLIYPLTGFLEMSPGYRETDISGWFLLFFTLFFGMIFGDAAYGAILILVSIICILKTAKKGTPLIFKFLLLMSFSNFIWGVLTCSWFGFNTARVPQLLQNISLPLIVNTSSETGWLASYNANNFWIAAGLVGARNNVDVMNKAITNNLMLFCFTVALVQLAIAHIKGVIANIKSPKVLAELGQLGMLLGMYFVVLSLVVFNTGFGGVKPWQFGSLAGGFLLVFVFGNYEGSVLKSLAVSCANILTNVLGITNVFSDIMSYIRLWAVGLAGASIASTVDGFAGPMLGHFIFFVFGVALFIFGHGFNMVLNVLSVLVHGVRLNTLEFSSHLGLTWSGFAYKPFAKR